MMTSLSSKPPAQSPTLSHAAVQKVADANNTLGFRLLDELDRGAGGRNIFFSPFSLSNALLMARNGAGGQTEREMAETLGVADVPADYVNKAYAQLLPALRNPDEGVEFSVANALWVKEGLRLATIFQNASERFYGAHTESMPLTTAEGIARINRWVSEITRGKIPAIVQSIDPVSVLVLTNALYFHAKWRTPFKPFDTHPAPFSPEKGEQKQVKTMCREGQMDYLETDDFQAVSLSYGTGRMSLFVFLPSEGTSVAKLAKSLGAGAWESMLSQFGPREVRLYLPKIHIDFESSLVGPLEQLGMRTAFGQHADFQPMGLRDVAISEVLHKATLDVDEKGSTATAATVLMLRTMCIDGSDFGDAIVMRVDRPFLCVFRDNATGINLFQGIVRDPG